MTVTDRTLTWSATRAGIVFLLVNSVLVLALVVVIDASVSSGAQKPRQNDPEVISALREGGLKAAAKVSGGQYVAVTEWLSEVAHSMESLVEQADVVLVGEVVENRSHLSASGEYITTDYRMKVQRVFKGDVPPQTHVVFQVMGGKVMFEDGLSAVIETRGFVRPSNGARVVIFADVFPTGDRLMPTTVLDYARGAQVFRLVGMGRGVIELPIDDNQRVRLNALGASDPAARKLRSMTVGRFLSELASIVRGTPKTDNYPQVKPDI